MTSSDAVTLQGRSFTVATGNTTELKDYKRNKDNEFDHVEVEEKVYTLDEEKYWGRFVDQLDERDSNGQVNINYVIARQAAEVVAPYLDELRFGAALGNVSDNVAMGKTAGANNAYNAVLDVSEKLDELGIQKNACSSSLQVSTKRSSLKSFVYHMVTQIRKSLEKDMLVNWMITQSIRFLLNS
ncbi:Carbohydrate-binding family V/XII [Streptococcus pneumoniae]|nr:Carbohydrate-binding family V/XII [Streptococcus pneumoniae]